MDYAIIGFGPVGQALARMFARQSMDVMVASRRPPADHAAQAGAIGPTVRPVPLAEALAARTVLLAVPFRQVDALAAVVDWQGKIVVDVTNAYGVPVEELGGQPSSGVTARKLAGSRLVKAWNHLAAAKLAADPTVHGGRRVIFVSSDDAEAAAEVSGLAERLGFAPVALGSLAEGGALVQARGESWAPLIFQDLVKFA
ncbi:NAD(P)-binding domain-containing protein [Lichenihabitans sp. Uapishka_5]|uniref:NADPH-dependent F420 reductase n=1 Tax=Lichenihabitans sp. Uapishka_5 TaxID=3037302 RepID=UPI0029E7EC93|nr:NAD(P)-binding domain-containing protein [Lichenihabitans sp. Uapishka_5]MDX7953606.1 NAD(P)-binding domain-containing protein [Lichenihabitans sp. Uapishka_5]